MNGEVIGITVYSVLSVLIAALLFFLKSHKVGTVFLLLMTLMVSLFYWGKGIKDKRWITVGVTTTTTILLIIFLVLVSRH